mgnify:FL=1
MNYLAENFQYPSKAKKNKTEGRVMANFIVNKEGSISNVNVVRGIDSLLDAEAIRVL